MFRPICLRPRMSKFEIITWMSAPLPFLIHAAPGFVSCRMQYQYIQHISANRLFASACSVCPSQTPYRRQLVFGAHRATDNAQEVQVE